MAIYNYTADVDNCDRNLKRTRTRPQVTYIFSPLSDGYIAIKVNKVFNGTRPIDQRDIITHLLKWWDLFLAMDDFGIRQRVNSRTNWAVDRRLQVSRNSWLQIASSPELYTHPISSQIRDLGLRPLRLVGPNYRLDEEWDRDCDPTRHRQRCWTMEWWNAVVPIWLEGVFLIRHRTYRPQQNLGVRLTERWTMRT